MHYIICTKICWRIILPWYVKLFQDCSFALRIVMENRWINNSIIDLTLNIWYKRSFRTLNDPFGVTTFVLFLVKFEFCTAPPGNVPHSVCVVPVLKFNQVLPRLFGKYNPILPFCIGFHSFLCSFEYRWEQHVGWTFIVTQLEWISLIQLVYPSCLSQLFIPAVNGLSL